MFYKQKLLLLLLLPVLETWLPLAVVIKSVFFKWSLVQSCPGWAANHSLTVETPSQLQSSQTKAETTRPSVSRLHTDFLYVRRESCKRTMMLCCSCTVQTVQAASRQWNLISGQEGVAAEFSCSLTLSIKIDVSESLLCYIWLRRTRQLSFMFYVLRHPRVDMVVCEDLQPPFLSAAMMFDSESL